MVIYRLNCGSWVLTVDGVVYDKAQKLLTLALDHPNAFIVGGCKEANQVRALMKDKSA